MIEKSKLDDGDEVFENVVLTAAMRDRDFILAQRLVVRFGNAVPHTRRHLCMRLTALNATKCVDEIGTNQQEDLNNLTRSERRQGCSSNVVMIILQSREVSASMPSYSPWLSIICVRQTTLDPRPSSSLFIRNNHLVVVAISKARVDMHFSDLLTYQDPTATRYLHKIGVYNTTDVALMLSLIRLVKARHGHTAWLDA